MHRHPTPASTVAASCAVALTLLLTACSSAPAAGPTTSTATATSAPSRATTSPTPTGEPLDVVRGVTSRAQDAGSFRSSQDLTFSPEGLTTHIETTVDANAETVLNVFSDPTGSVQVLWTGPETPLVSRDAPGPEQVWYSPDAAQEATPALARVLTGKNPFGDLRDLDGARTATPTAPQDGGTTAYEGDVDVSTLPSAAAGTAPTQLTYRLELDGAGLPHFLELVRSSDTRTLRQEIMFSDWGSPSVSVPVPAAAHIRPFPTS